MKKFFKFGKDKNKSLTPEPSPTLSKHGSSSDICGYEIREKELGKLHKAAWNGDLNKVKQLAKKDASPLDKENRTPLHLACVRGYASVVQELLEWKAKPNLCDNANKTPLLKAVECKQDECVKLLLEHKADPNVKDIHGESSLHYAARDGAISTLKLLLNSDKIFIDIKNKDGQTPLHIALKKRNLKVAEILLQRGADINAPDNKGYTVLMEAAQEGATDLVKFILEHGADAKREDESGWTADDIALREHQDEVREILTEYVCGNSAELDPGMTMDTGSRKKQDSKDMIPPPTIYGGPACNEEGDYSEIDASKMSEAAGGLDTWNSDDESEIHLEDKNVQSKSCYSGNESLNKGLSSSAENAQERLHDLANTCQQSADVLSSNDVDSSDGDDLHNNDTKNDETKTAKANLSKILSQREGSKPDLHHDVSVISSQSVANESSLGDGDWSDEESVLSSARDKKIPVLLKQKSTQIRGNIQTQNIMEESKQNKEVTQTKTEDSWDDDSVLLSSPRHDKGAASGRRKLASVAENDDMDISNQNEKEDCDRVDAAHTETKAGDGQKKVLDDLNLSDVEDVSDPDFGDDSCMSGLCSEPAQKVMSTGITKKQESVNDSDWDSTEASDLSPHAKAALAQLTNSKDVVLLHKHVHLEGRDIPKITAQTETLDTVKRSSQGNDSPDEDSKWDSEESEATEPPPLPTKAPPAELPSVATHDISLLDEDEDVEEEGSWEEENRLKKEQEQRSRKWQWEMEQQKLKQQKEAIDELQKEKEEQERYSPTTINNKQNAKTKPLLYEKEEQKVHEVRDMVVVNTIRDDRDSFPANVQEDLSRRLSEQCQAVDQELAELRVQKQVSRLHRSFDDEDTFHNVPDMESPRKMDLSGGGYLLAGVTTTDVQDDDCLSYSSTEHEASIHDDLRSHQLVPVSFSLSTDSTNVMRLQQQLRDTQQKLEKERSARMSLENKRKSVDKEREELIQKLEDVTKAKSLLEQQKIDMEATIRNLQYQLKEESEKSKNMEVLYNKTKEQLSHKDDQFTREVESKQMSDLSLRNLQMELHTTQTIIKQLEEEKEDLVRQLTHEKSVRLLQEQMNEEQMKYQENMSKDIKDSDAEVELERLRSHSKDDHDMMATENAELRKKIEDLKASLKINEEALAEARMKYNMELTALNTENTKLKANLESEKTTREKLESEIQSLKHRLETTSAELTKAQEARNELERTGFTQQENLSQQLEKRSQQLTHLQEENQNLLQRISELDNKSSKLENELHIANATLIERTNQLSTIQRELDQRRNNQEAVERELQKTKEENARLQTKLETLQEKTASLQQEVASLRQQLDDTRIQAIGVGKEEGERFTMMLSALREDHDKSGLENYLHKLEQEKSDLEFQLKQERQKMKSLQEELDGSFKHVNGSSTGDVQIAQLERENREIRSLYEEEKKKSQRTSELKRKAEMKLSAEQERIAELQKEVVLLKTHLKAAKKRLKLEEVSRKAQAEASLREQLEGKTRELEAELSAVRNMEKSYNKLDKAKRKLEEDLSLYRSHVDNNFTEQTDLERIKAELEANARLELNRKLEEVNIYLEEQARARDKLDRMRDINEAEMKKEFERSRNELLEDINRLRQSYTELLNQKELGTDDAQRFRRLYETELQAREQLAKRLEKALKMQERAQTLIDRQHKGGSIYGSAVENGWTSIINKPLLSHNVNDALSTKIQHELDRSIAKHLEKGPHIDMIPPSRSLHETQLSSSPYKSSSDYLSVLKKNYLL